jgi:hypothetical protein
MNHKYAYDDCLIQLLSYAQDERQTAVLYSTDSTSNEKDHSEWWGHRPAPALLMHSKKNAHPLLHSLL